MNIAPFGKTTPSSTEEVHTPVASSAPATEIQVAKVADSFGSAPAASSNRSEQMLRHEAHRRVSGYRTEMQDASPSENDRTQLREKLKKKKDALVDRSHRAGQTAYWTGLTSGPAAVSFAAGLHPGIAVASSALTFVGAGIFHSYHSDVHHNAMVPGLRLSKLADKFASARQPARLERKTRLGEGAAAQEVLARFCREFSEASPRDQAAFFAIARDWAKEGLHPSGKTLRKAFQKVLDAEKDAAVAPFIAQAVAVDTVLEMAFLRKKAPAASVEAFIHAWAQLETVEQQTLQPLLFARLFGPQGVAGPLTRTQKIQLYEALEAPRSAQEAFDGFTRRMEWMTPGDLTPAHCKQVKRLLKDLPPPRAGDLRYEIRGRFFDNYQSKVSEEAYALLEKPLFPPTAEAFTGLLAAAAASHTLPSRMEGLVQRFHALEDGEKALAIQSVETSLGTYPLNEEFYAALAKQFLPPTLASFQNLLDSALNADALTSRTGWLFERFSTLSREEQASALAYTEGRLNQYLAGDIADLDLPTALERQRHLRDLLAQLGNTLNVGPETFETYWS